MRPPSSPTLFPYTTLFRSPLEAGLDERVDGGGLAEGGEQVLARLERRAAQQGRRPALLLPGVLDVDEQRSEEHTSELQSRRDLVCRLLLEKKKNIPLTLNV